jgi:hypothetical protein
MQVPGASRRIRVLSDWILSLLFRSDIVTFGGLVQAPPIVTPHTGWLVATPTLPDPGAEESESRSPATVGTE